MNRISPKILIFLVMGFFPCEGREETPFPQSQISREILERFYPLILEELDKEFAHQNDGRTYRDTREYGYSFFKMQQGDFDYLPPPLFFQELGAHICACFGHDPQEFTNIILSSYETGFHLEPHIDAHTSHRYNNCFYFDEKVYGIIIEPDSTGHLYFARDETSFTPPLDLEPIYSLEEKSGTIFCLQGKYRMAPYFHGVSKVSQKRISITFRRVILED